MNKHEELVSYRKTKEWIYGEIKDRLKNLVITREQELPLQNQLQKLFKVYPPHIDTYQGAILLTTLLSSEYQTIKQTHAYGDIRDTGSMTDNDIIVFVYEYAVEKYSDFIINFNRYLESANKREAMDKIKGIVSDFVGIA